MGRPNYQNLYDDMISQRNEALKHIALLESKIVQLAAEVERLTAATAALRAQLDAAGEWRPVGGEPPLYDEIEIKRRGRVSYSGTHYSSIVYATDSGNFICHWIEDNGWKWRPAPPQE